MGGKAIGYVRVSVVGSRGAVVNNHSRAPLAAVNTEVARSTCASRFRTTCGSGNALDDRDQLVHVVAVTAGKLNEFESASGECTLRRGPGDRHAAAALKLE